VWSLKLELQEKKEQLCQYETLLILKEDQLVLKDMIITNSEEELLRPVKQEKLLQASHCSYQEHSPSTEDELKLLDEECKCRSKYTHALQVARCVLSIRKK